MKEHVSKGGIPSGNMPVSKLKQFCLQALNQRLGQLNKANPKDVLLNSFPVYGTNIVGVLKSIFQPLLREELGCEQ